MKRNEVSSASFRDPSGFVYYKNDILYRQISPVSKDNFDFFIEPGLYHKLCLEKMLITHQEVNPKFAYDRKAYKIIKPELVPFISYPYGWSFSMLNDAALLTLKIQQCALEYNMSLKDANAFNIQFVNGHPILIDTLSFEKYRDGLPWVAYRQFCQHFLGPLSLMAYTDIRLNQLLKIYIDGIPLDLVSKLLPNKTYFNFFILFHVHLHSKSQNKWADKQLSTKNLNIKMPKVQMQALLDNLYSGVSKLELKKLKTEWSDYYNFTNYNTKAFKDKGDILKKMFKISAPDLVWDLGANEGRFSRIAASCGAKVIAFDIDPIAVEKNYLKVKKDNDSNVLPILLDLTNPTSDYGWANEERISLLKRGPADTVMALALIHHLAIGNNLPFPKIASLFSKMCHYLIIEFVPKKDSQVKKLLASREDIFLNYNQANFETAFNQHFDLINKSKIRNSSRIMYLYKTK